MVRVPGVFAAVCVAATFRGLERDLERIWMTAGVAPTVFVRLTALFFAAGFLIGCPCLGTAAVVDFGVDLAWIVTGFINGERTLVLGPQVLVVKQMIVTIRNLSFEAKHTATIE